MDRRRKIPLFVCAVGVCLFCVALLYNTGSSNVQVSSPPPSGKDRQHYILADHQPRIVFYNRVGKCGSRSHSKTVERLSKKNNFTFSQSYVFNEIRPEMQEMLAEMKKISELKPPIFYHRHILYLDFEKFGYRKPVYINLIRDPIERFVSWYNYVKYGAPSVRVVTIPPQGFELDINECLERKTGSCRERFMFQIGSYFCGFDETCLIPSPESVALAIKHIDEDYLFIGLTEEFENSLRIFERVLPEFYKGALEDWMQHREMKNRTASFKYDKLSDEWREKLKTEEMVHEYEVYNHVRRKFEDLKKIFGIA